MKFHMGFVGEGGLGGVLCEQSTATVLEFLDDAMTERGTSEQEVSQDRIWAKEEQEEERLRTIWKELGLGQQKDEPTSEFGSHGADAKRAAELDEARTGSSGSAKPKEQSEEQNLKYMVWLLSSLDAKVRVWSLDEADSTSAQEEGDNGSIRALRTCLREPENWHATPRCSELWEQHQAEMPVAQRMAEEEELDSMALLMEYGDL